MSNMLYGGNSNMPRNRRRRLLSPEERRRRKRQALLIRRIKAGLVLVAAIGLIWLLSAFIFDRGEDKPEASPTPAASSPSPTAGGATPAPSPSPSPGASERSDAGDMGSDLLRNADIASLGDVNKLALNTASSDPYLILANKTFKLERNFVQENMINIAQRVNSTKDDIKLEKQAAAQYELMVAKMAEQGIRDILAASGYRDYARQEVLYNAEVKENMDKNMGAAEAAVEAAKIVAPPGSSEHQTGLTLDVTAAGIGFVLEEEFEETDAYKWLDEHAWEYGFIIRYPKDKVHITQISYEPWHLRYVGAEHAERIEKGGMCLEEYLGLLTLNALNVS